LLAGDYDGDGKVDIIPLMNTAPTHCGVWLAGGDGLSFTYQQNWTSNWSDYSASGEYDPKSLCLMDASIKVETLDFDRDGLTDISVNAHDSGGHLYRYFLHSTGTDFVEEGDDDPITESITPPRPSDKNVRYLEALAAKMYGKTRVKPGGTCITLPPLRPAFFRRVRVIHDLAQMRHVEQFVHDTSGHHR
jgi:hypothetical protein